MRLRRPSHVLCHGVLNLVGRSRRRAAGRAPLFFLRRRSKEAQSKARANKERGARGEVFEILLTLSRLAHTKK